MRFSVYDYLQNVHYISRRDEILIICSGGGGETNTHSGSGKRVYNTSTSCIGHEKYKKPILRQLADTSLFQREDLGVREFILLMKILYKFEFITNNN